jgi:hypothetical protein
MFVLVEMDRDADASTLSPVVIFIETADATIDPLPGSVICSPNGDGGVSLAVSADGDMGLHEVGVPYIGLANDRLRHDRESGVQLQIPPGENDVVLVGAAYTEDSGPQSCGMNDRQLITFASARIVRAPPPDLATPVDLAVPDLTLEDLGLGSDGGDMSAALDAGASD